MDELGIICSAVKYLPTVIVVGVLLHLLVDEYVRQMELRGLIRRRTVEPPAPKSADEDPSSRKAQS